MVLGNGYMLFAEADLGLLLGQGTDFWSQDILTHELNCLSCTGCFLHHLYIESLSKEESAMCCPVKMVQVRSGLSRSRDPVHCMRGDVTCRVH